jgi:hypothetical protein
MKSRNKALSTVLLDSTIALSLATVVLAGIALAHSGSTYYPSKWKRDLSVAWRIDNSVPGGAFRNRILDGAQEWNRLAPNMRFSHVGGDATNVNIRRCSPNRPYQRDGVFYGPIDGRLNVLAFVVTCTFPGTNELKHFQMKFDSAENWYTGTGTPGSSAFDVWGVAAHEFGHATGFSGPYAKGHFNPRGGVCTSSPKHTMCPTISLGSTGSRSLEEHERHTFRNVYG